MNMKKVLVIATCIIAACFLGLSCQKEEPKQEQAPVKHLGEEKSAQQQPLQAQQAPVPPSQYEEKEGEGALEKEGDQAEEPEENNENGDDEQNVGNSYAYIQSDLQDIIDANPGTELASRMEAVMNKVSEANSKRAANQKGAAVAELQAAVGLLESAIADGLFDSAEGRAVIDDLTDEIDEIKELNPTP